MLWALLRTQNSETNQDAQTLTKLPINLLNNIILYVSCNAHDVGGIED